MTRPFYHIAQLRWIDRKGASQFRQGNAFILATRLEKLRCVASLRLLDGTLIGGCERVREKMRLKWAWWYDKDALVAGHELTRNEIWQAACEETNKEGI